MMHIENIAKYEEKVKEFAAKLHPVDSVLLIENVRVFSGTTKYMSHALQHYIKPYLESLNGAEGLKSDFGCDEFTSLFRVVSFNRDIAKESFSDRLGDRTPMIHRVMKLLEAAQFDRYPDPHREECVSSALLAQLVSEEFASLAEYRAGRCPSTRRHALLVVHSRLSADGISALEAAFSSQSVTLAVLSPRRNDQLIELYDKVNQQGLSATLDKAKCSPRWELVRIPPAVFTAR
uniref:Med25_VWA domain-containing protein n=2 Tax=Macrostomum lignano TaxID=282301 RepID=A0A1I8G0P8_9PLAT